MLAGPSEGAIPGNLAISTALGESLARPVLVSRVLVL